MSTRRRLQPVRIRGRGDRRAVGAAVRGYAERLLVQAGCPARSFGEEPRDWLARVLPGLRRLRHPGNFTYLFGLGRVEQRRLARLHPARLPYPQDHAVETAGVTLAA